MKLRVLDHDCSKMAPADVIYEPCSQEKAPECYNKIISKLMARELSFKYSCYFVIYFIRETFLFARFCLQLFIAKKT